MLGGVSFSWPLSSPYYVSQATSSPPKAITKRIPPTPSPVPPRPSKWPALPVSMGRS
jgi:hypothetical protein